VDSYFAILQIRGAKQE